MKLLRTFPKFAFEFGLASWHWLGLREQTPRFATCFGDIFLESLDGWWFLDTIEGTLELRWTSAVTMYAELEPPEGRATYLMDDLVREAQARGIHLGDEDIYTFNPHPALGGELGGDGLGTMRFELALNWVGQMHDRVLHNSGELRLPPMPTDGRRAGTAQVSQAWDAAWARDETFDVPFEDYLATSTFAAVATPRRRDDGDPSPLRAPRHGESSQTPSATQNYAAPNHAAPNHAAQNYAAQDPAESWTPAPYPTEQAQAWPAQDSDASHWSGWTHAAQDWPEQAPEQFEAGPAGQQPGLDPPHQEADWAPYDATQHTTDDASYAGDYREPSGHTPDHSEWGEPAWETPGSGNPGWESPAWESPGWEAPRQDNPGWGATPWGSQQWGDQATAAGDGHPQQGPHTDEPFTAWEDLWGKR